MRTIQILILIQVFLLPLCLKVHAAKEELSDTEKLRIVDNEWKNRLPKNIVAKNEEGRVDLPYKAPDLPKEFTFRISLHARDLKLSEALQVFQNILPLNIILGPAVEDKKISVELSDVTILRALNTILYSLGYGFKIKEGDLIILGQETRVYHLILPPLNQSFSDITSNESTVQSSNQNAGLNSDNRSQGNNQIKLGTKILVSNESQKISFWDDVSQNLKDLVTPQGRFSINKPAGVVIVTDTPFNLEKISQYFDDLNRRVAQQIEVDVKVVEVSLDKENRFGVDWNALANNLKMLNSLSLATNLATENFTNPLLRISGNGSKPGSGITNSGISIVIDALAKQGKIEVVSQPRIKILNNQLAVIQVGSTQSFIENSTVQVTQTGTITSLSTSEVQEGITMRLLGSIVGEEIYLSVAPVITTIDKIRSITSGATTIEAPQTTTKSINTLVKVKEGESVAIGGLITSNHQNNKQEAPILSKIPILGKLFQYSQEVENKKELVIFITPRKV